MKNQNQQPRIMGAGVSLDAVMQARKQQAVQALKNRGSHAFALLQAFLASEKETPSLPHCRDLVNRSFDVIDYFAIKAGQAPAQEAAPKIETGG